MDREKEAEHNRSIIAMYSAWSDTYAAKANTWWPIPSRWRAFYSYSAHYWAAQANWYKDKPKLDPPDAERMTR